MKNTVDELNQVVNSFAPKIGGMSEKELTAKPLPHKWSKKEVLGHLIDSAQNNLRRFICGQYETTPPKITYEQDFWVAANNYQQMEKDDVISLWKLMNQRISAVLSNMPQQHYGRNCDTGKTTENLHSLRWLAEDYVKHMKHHLNQIIPGSFDVIYK
jgi:hypothetical protein